MSHTILVVEDDYKLNEEIVSYLEMEQYQVYSALNGNDGLQKILEIVPDLVICDIHMPDMDGYTVLSEVRSLPEISHIPFIFLTAQTSPEAMRQGMALGADDYLTKPFRFSDLLTAMRVRINKQQYLETQILESFARLLISNHDRIRHKIATQIQSDIITPLNSLRIYSEMLNQPDITSRLHLVLKHIEKVQASLTPDALVYLGLLPMVEWLIHKYQEIGQLRITLQNTDLEPLPTLTKEVLYHIFAILDEALNNIVQHAKASEASIQIQQTDESLRFIVSDNGIGFDSKKLWDEVKTLGIVTMRERSWFCHGNFHIRSDTGVGTTVHFSVSLEDAIQTDVQSLSFSSPASSVETVASKSLIKIVISHEDELIQQGLQHIMTSEEDMTIIARNATWQSFLNLLEDGISQDVVIMSLPLFQEAHQRKPSILRNLKIIVLGYEDQSMNYNELKFIQGYLLHSQVVSKLPEAIRSIHEGNQYIDTETIRSSKKSSPLDLLTRREKQILEYVVNNYHNSDIADELVISVRTVETHRANMMQKLNLKNKSELVIFALKQGIISLDD